MLDPDGVQAHHPNCCPPPFFLYSTSYTNKIVIDACLTCAQRVLVLTTSFVCFLFLFCFWRGFGSNGVALYVTGITLSTVSGAMGNIVGSISSGLREDGTATDRGRRNKGGRGGDGDGPVTYVVVCFGSWHWPDLARVVAEDLLCFPSHHPSLSLSLSFAVLTP